MIIDVLKDTTELETYWNARNAQFVEDREMINLVKPIPKKGVVQWVLNDPKTLYDTCTALMSAYMPQIRLPLTINYTDEEKTKMNKVERFVIGLIRKYEHQTRQRGGSSWLRDMAYFINSGMYAAFVKVLKNGKDVDFVADIFDPMTVYPEWDSTKMVKCARSYIVAKRLALAMAESWGIKDFTLGDKQESVKVINYWAIYKDKVYNAIYLGDREVKSLQEEPDCKRIPILVGHVGSPDVISPNWQVRKGESVIASNRDTYKHNNQLVSLMVQALAKTVFPNILTFTDSGEPAVKAEDITGDGKVIPLRTGEMMETFKNANVPPEMAAVLQLMDSRAQRGGLPYVVYGGVPFELSGFAISQLMAALRYKIMPYVTLMQEAIGDIALETINQFREKNYGKVKLITTNPLELNKGMFFVEEFGKEDIPEVTYIEVKIPLTSALDKIQQITFARQAMSPPQLLSRETIWDEVLEVQDAEQEYTRIIQDQTLELPFLKQLSMLEQLRLKAKVYREGGRVGEAKAIEGYIQTLELQLGIKKPSLTSPTGQELLGVPSQQMPPEMGANGAINPDMIRSIMGAAPPSPTR